MSDGFTQVNGWHWAEKDVLVWARQRLTELLGKQGRMSAGCSTKRSFKFNYQSSAGNVTLTKEAGFLLQTTSVSTVTGEAFVNNRKRKLIPSYEIALQGSWKGVAAVLMSCCWCGLLARTTKPGRLSCSRSRCLDQQLSAATCNDLPNPVRLVCTPDAATGQQAYARTLLQSSQCPGQLAPWSPLMRKCH